MSVKFNLGDKPWDYELRFDFNELADAEPIAGCNLMAAIASWPNLSCRELRGLLYALLKPTQPKLLLGEAGGLLTQNMQASYGAIRQTLREADLLVEEAPAGPQPELQPELPPSAE